jgi:hypothetical protein
VSAGAIVARLNFAVALAEGKMPGTTGGGAAVAAREGDVDAWAAALVGGELSESTRATIDARLASDEPGAHPAQVVAGLVLGSPEFQRQ